MSQFKPGDQVAIAADARYNQSEWDAVNFGGATAGVIEDGPDQDGDYWVIGLCVNPVHWHDPKLGQVFGQYVNEDYLTFLGRKS